MKQADYIGKLPRRECSQIQSIDWARMHANGQYRGYDEIVSFIEGNLVGGSFKQGRQARTWK